MLKQFLFSLLLIPVILQAQGDFEAKKLALIKEIEDYRNSLLEEDLGGMIVISNVVKKLEEQKIPKNTQTRLLSDISIGIIAYNYDLEDVSEHLEEYLSDSVIQLISKEEYFSIAQHYELIDLIRFGVLHKYYPFAVNYEASVFKELEFYEIENTETIGEIGAGNGIFSFILGLYDKTTYIFVNEIDVGFYYYYEAKLNKQEDRFRYGQMYPVFGTEKKTYFGNRMMDKIILRKTFHHFTNPKSMLKSIKKSLKKDGELYIYEALPRLNVGENICDELMTEEEIKTALKEGGFELDKEIILEGVMIMKYRISK